MREQIINLKNEALSSVTTAKSKEELERLRIAYLGRKGKFSAILKLIPKLEEEERKEIGRLANESKNIIENAIAENLGSINETKDEDQWFDFSAPGEKPKIGSLHLVSQAIREISAIFEHIGFTRVRYPEVEWDWYAFTGLNMPKEHPARDEWETFFIKDLTNPKYGVGILTPHTSSGQIREMERVRNSQTNGNQAPIRMLNVAKCYRRQSDASHAPMFYQFEGLVIDKNINIGQLKGTLDYFVKSYFGPDRKVRIRPFHFQFTEPSFEVDVTCLICKGKGCKVCKEGWVEIGGSGMVHPNVLKSGGIDPEKYTGYAFGWGVERVMMMKYGIPDIRLLFENDLRFLNQF